MPSPTSTTVPTLRVSTPESNESMADLMMLVISSDRMAMVRRLLEGARDELVPQPLEATPDAPIDQAATAGDEDTPPQAGVDLHVERDAAAGGLFKPRGELPDLVLGELGRRRSGGMRDPLALVIEPPVLGGDARQVLDPAAAKQQPDEIGSSHGHAVPEQFVEGGRPALDRDRWVGEYVERALIAGEARGNVEIGPPRFERAVTRRHLEGGFGVAACRSVSPSHQFLASPSCVEAARNSLTRRRCRSSVIDSPTTQLAAARARSATSARSSPMARCFSASISSVARSRMRSSSARVAAMSVSRVSCASRWARARMLFASLRASASVATRSASAFSRSRRACSASFRPCSIRSRRSSSIRETGLNANVQIRAKNTMKFSALTITQNRLTWNSAGSPSAVTCAATRPRSDATARTSTIVSPSGTGYAGWMKIASRPTTIASTPSPSANAARMIAMPRIWPAASGFRPIAWADSPPMIPTPMPGPMTPRAASPAPK